MRNHVVLLLLFVFFCACTRHSAEGSAPTGQTADNADAKGAGATDDLASTSISDLSVGNGSATGTTPRGGPKFLIGLRLQPSDMMSDIAATPIRVWIDNDGNPIPKVVMDGVVAALQLHRADGTMVDFNVQTYSPAEYALPVNVDKSDSSPPASPPNGEPPQPFGYVEIVPKSVLSGGWYELSLDRIPDGCAIGSPELHAPAPKFGVAGVRFNPVSAPVLVSAYTCTKKTGARVAGIKVSEPTQLEFGQFLTFGTSATPCVPVQTKGAIAATLQFSQCPVDITVPWHVKLQPGLKALSGSMVALDPSSAAGNKAIDFAPVPESSGCRTVRW